MDFFLCWFLNQVNSLQRCSPQCRPCELFRNRFVHIFSVCTAIFWFEQVVVRGGLTTEPLWGRILIKFSHFLLSLSSALNILIYSYKVIFQQLYMSSCVFLVAQQLYRPSCFFLYVFFCLFHPQDEHTRLTESQTNQTIHNQIFSFRA